MKELMLGFIVVCFGVLYSQEVYRFTKIGPDEVQELEDKHESIFIDTVEFGITLANFEGNHLKTATLIYKRTNDDFSPKLHVWYHFDKVSGEILAITYNWDFYNPGFNPDKNRDLIFATSKREDEYRQKYNSINEILTNKIGVNKEVNLIVDNDHSFNEMTYWENDELYVCVFRSR